MTPPRTTGVIVVGDEILAGFTLDTNSHHLAARAFQAGFPVTRIETVADDVEAIAAAVRAGAADASIARLAVCGGVGPTPDDRTLEGVARGLGVPLEENPEALAVVAGRVRRLFEAGRLPSLEISPANRRMALVPAGARVLHNPEGMAPPLAMRLEGDDRWLFVLPGVPREFVAIVDDTLLPEFFAGARAPAVTELRYSGIPEAAFAEAMTIVTAEYPDVVVGSYPQRTRREVILRLRGPEAARVAAAADRLAGLMGGAPAALNAEEEPAVTDSSPRA